MSQALGNTYAEIHYRNQQGYAGSGFLIDEKHLVTCTHVLVDALGDTRLTEGIEITVDLRYLDITKIIMEVVHYYPVVEGNITKSQLEDMVLLKFKDGKAPKGIPHPMVEYPDFGKQDGHKIKIYSHKQNNFVDAKNKSHSPEGWLILDTDISVEKGDSGSPVWNENLQAITGMLVARKRKELTCYAIPTTKIREAFKKYLTVSKNQGANEFEKEDEAFLKKVKASIQADLKGSELFQGKLASTYGFSSAQPQEFIEHLAGQCQEGKFDEIVRKSEGALLDSWEEVDKDKPREVEAVFTSAVGLVNKLSVFNVIHDLYKYQLNRPYESLQLPRIELMSLEVFISRISRTIPSAKNGNSGMKGVRNLGKIFTLDQGIKPLDAVFLILKAIASSLIPYLVIDEQNKEQLAKVVSTALERRKKHENLDLKQSCFILVPLEDSSALKDSAVQQELKMLIPELDWIEFNSGDCTQLFIIESTALMVALGDFYLTYDKLMATWTNYYKK